MLIIDDHQLFIEGIRHVVKRLTPEALVSESNSAEHALGLLEAGATFDLVFLDLKLPQMNGLSVLQRIHDCGIWLPVVVISGEEDLRTIKSALDLGALGFIPKAFSGEQLLTALESILAGNLFVPEALSKKLEGLQARRFEQDGNITRRQKQVLELLAEGYTNRQIAVSLSLTEHTIKAHVSALFIELNAGNRTECVRIAESRGLL
ncbi:MAG: response regulator transcription factor [Marinobacter sp.]|nr:response regulator transcription factor [Marinobacter sp.]